MINRFLDILAVYQIWSGMSREEGERELQNAVPDKIIST